MDRAGGQPKQIEKPPDTKLVNGPEREREMELKIMECSHPLLGLINLVVTRLLG